MGDLTDEDIERYALKGSDDEIIRVLDDLWGRIADLHSSPDFRDADGEFLEGIYVRAKARAIRDASEAIHKLWPTGLDSVKLARGKALVCGNDLPFATGGMVLSDGRIAMNSGSATATPDGPGVIRLDWSQEQP